MRIRFINVVDLMTLQPDERTSARIAGQRVRFDVHGGQANYFCVITAIRGSIHRLTYRRTNHENLHVRGYKEEGTTTTPFDMTVMNDMDRFHLAGDVVDRVPRLQRIGAHFKQFCVIN